MRQKGLKVEMTEHGDPYEGERKKKGGMDPVAKNPKDRDGDVNNDGKKDSTDKYIYNRRDAINAAIAKKKGEVKEEFLVDGTTSTEGQNKGKITGTGVDNSARITVNPENKADAHGMNKRRGIYAHTETEITASRKRLFEMIAEKKQADACAHNGKGEECGVHGMKACPDTEVKEEKEEKKEDTRANKTYRDLLKNKMRSAGMNVFAACGDEDKLEDSAMKAMTAAFVRPGEDGKMKMVSLYDKGDSSKMKKEETEQVDEGMGAAAQKVAQTALDKGAEFMDTNPVGKAIKNVLKPFDSNKVPPAVQQNRERNNDLKDKVNKMRYGRRSVTAGGGTPDTQNADKESERLGKNRMRQAGY